MTNDQRQSLEEAVARLEQEAATAVAALQESAAGRDELEQHRANDGALADVVTRLNAVADSLSA